MHTVILGFDAFDPQIFERLSESGLLPNLTRYLEHAGYSRFTVANPPQSEVSWTSIATGLDPGGHGIFDFVHRDPKTYAFNVSLLPTKRIPGVFSLSPRLQLGQYSSRLPAMDIPRSAFGGRLLSRLAQIYRLILCLVWVHRISTVN